MSSARPPLDSPEGPPANAQPLEAEGQPLQVSQEELNAWRRGFTPQAEIWNGRLAMLGLSVGLTVLIVARLAHHS
ncbi:MAG: high light inducible protein [Cyanobium sp.]